MKTILPLLPALFVNLLLLQPEFLTASPTNFQLICPSNVTVDCGADINNLSKYGDAYILKDYKKLPAPAPTVEYNLTGCNTGTIKRTWRVEDPNWKWHTCIQIITISNAHGGAFDETDISWPPSYELTSCTPKTDPNDLPKPYDRPTFSVVKCSQPMYSYKDQKFTINAGCMKLLRTWKVIDWCQYIANANPPVGVWSYTQVIKIIPSDTPVITCPRDTIVYATQKCDTAFVKLDSARASTMCGIPIVIRNTSPFSISKGPDASGNYPAGTTKFYYIAEYGCGKEIKCEVKVTVKNKIGPVPYCLTGIIVALMAVDTNRDGTADDGMIEIWASDLNKGSYHPCSKLQKLKYSFSADTTDKARIFTCKQLGKNSVEIWVTDANGNQSFCRTMVEVQNNNARIPDCKRDSLGGNTGTISYSISGITLNTNNGATQSVALKLYDPQSLKIDTTITYSITSKKDSIITASGLKIYIYKNDTLRSYRYDTTGHLMLASKESAKDGKYSFVNLTPKKSYMVQAVKNSDYLANLDINDVVKIFKYTIGLEANWTAYQYLAADVDCDKVISFADYFYLYDLILGHETDFGACPSYTLIPKSFSFKDPSDPWATPIPNTIQFDSLTSNKTAVDFIAVKTGNVDLSNTFQNVSSRSQQFLLQAQDQVLEANKDYTIILDWSKVPMGAEFAFKYDLQNMYINAIYAGYNNQAIRPLVQNYLPGQLIRFFEPLQQSKQMFLHLTTSKAGKLSELLTLDFNSWASVGEKQSMQLKYNTQEEGSSVLHFNLRKNKALVSLDLHEESNVVCELYDVSGKRLHLERIHMSEGKQEWGFNTHFDNSQRTILYRISSQTINAQGKIFVE